MADFHQTGVVTTLHRLRPNNIERLEADLEKFSRNRPIGLVLPALYSEFETVAMQKIVSELKRVRYLQRIVLVLGRATLEQYVRARTFFKDFYTPVTTVWIESERIQDLLRMLEGRGLSAGGDGKGRACWLAYGYLLAAGDCDVIALHDCDIVNYERQLLARLCYPVAHPHLGFEFCKGYYARVTDHLHGRVTRLFVTPLIRVLDGMAPGAPFLKYLDSFRYPLAGEFAMDINLARVNRIPGDWGLEVGVLAEVYRNCAVTRTCQVDLMEITSTSTSRCRKRTRPRASTAWLATSRNRCSGRWRRKDWFSARTISGVWKCATCGWRRIRATVTTPMPC